MIEHIEKHEQHWKDSEWAVGFHDRGMGAGNWGVILKDDIFDYSVFPEGPQRDYLKSLVIKCPNQATAEQIVKEHNVAIKLGPWASAAIDDPTCCVELKTIFKELLSD